jgi:hypothetical protein
LLRDALSPIARHNWPPIEQLIVVGRRDEDADVVQKVRRALSTINKATVRGGAGFCAPTVPSLARSRRLQSGHDQTAKVLCPAVDRGNVDHTAVDSSAVR